MKISSSPIDAFMGAAMVTGVEPIPRRADQGLRVYIGPRARGVHVHVDDPDQASDAEGVWCSTTGHLFATEIDPDTLCQCVDTEDDPQTPA